MLQTCKVASGHDVGVHKLILILILTLRWFHLELQQVDGGLLVDTVHAGPGQPVLAGGREDVVQKIVIIAEGVANEVHHNAGHC